MLPSQNAAPTSNADLSPCATVVMPVFNEAATVARMVENVLAQRPVKELVIVDDCSSDDTWKILQGLAQKETRIKIFHHEINQGKGAALRTGFQQATGSIVLIQDADLEYDPNEYYLLLWPILAERADVVFGSRFQGGGAHRVLYFWHSVGNKVLTTLSNMATNLNLTDMETCFKAFRAEVLKKITVEENRWYDLKVEVKGASVKCWLDGKLTHEVKDSLATTRGIFASSARDEKTGELILKIVNGANEPTDVTLALDGFKKKNAEATGVILTSANPKDENSIAEPAKVSPQPLALKVSNGVITHTFPGNSFTVLRVPAK